MKFPKSKKKIKKFMQKIIPAILATSEKEYVEKLNIIQDSNLFDWVQVDLMDGNFVKNKSIDVEVLRKYPSSLNLEAHLMVLNPDEWVEDLLKLGFKRLIAHAEITPQSLWNFIKKTHGKVEIGIAINPETDLQKVSAFLDKIDVLLILGVNPGFGGQEFKGEVLEKIKDLYSLRSDNTFKIEVDGGVNSSNVKDIVGAGADIVVLGSALLEGDINENYKKLKDALQIK